MNPKQKLAELRNIPCPVRFEVIGKLFVVEIQYFCGSDSELGQLEDEYLILATTSDAGDLLIKSDFSSDEVFHREGGDIESIDVTISDLPNAKRIYA